MNFINKNPRYSPSRTASTTSAVATPESIDGLLASGLTTGLLNTSALVSKAGDLAQTISLADVSYWTITGDKLTINGGDQKPFNLTFTNASEASLAEVRLHNMMNGSSY